MTKSSGSWKKRQKKEEEEGEEEEQNPNKITELTHIRVSQILQDFRTANDEVYTFEANLTKRERAMVHTLCRKMGMISKSSGRGNQRRISVRKTKRKVDTMEKENLSAFIFSKPAKEVLQDLFTRYPPDGKALVDEMIGKRSEKVEKIRGKKDGIFSKSSMTKAEITKKVEAIASRVENAPKLRQILEERSKLPIASFKDVITSAIESNQVVLISGETGCGKTTQVPQFLLDYMWGKGEACKIVCTQPRRISATSVAERISFERGENVGDNVGYKIRLESKGGKHSSIVFCTNGVLLRVLVSKGAGRLKTEASRKREKDDVSDITHIIVTQRSPLKGHGSLAHGYAWYETLTDSVKELIRTAGFGDFVLLLRKSSSDLAQIHALAERWWDTTNTFHMPFGEMTMTPTDFAMITGLRVGGRPLYHTVSITVRLAEVGEYIGAIPDDTVMPAKWLYDSCARRTDLTDAQMARAFLLYVLGSSLLCTRGDRVEMSLVGSLVELDQIHEYDWGGAGLATLYQYMGEVSRGDSIALGGFWRAWEIWSYEYLHMMAPSTRPREAGVIPQGHKWRKEATGRKVGAHDFVGFRSFLTNLREQDVSWTPWIAATAGASASLRSSDIVTRRRILFTDGARVRQWYLSERVTRQSIAAPAFFVPAPPPVIMRSSDQLVGAALAEALAGYDHSQYLSPPAGYEAFRSLRLMGNFPQMERLPEVAAPPSLPVWDWSLPHVDAGCESLLAIPRVDQGAPTIPPRYDHVPRSYADEGHVLVHSIRSWARAREWRADGIRVRADTIDAQALYRDRMGVEENQALRTQLRESEASREAQGRLIRDLEAGRDVQGRRIRELESEVARLRVAGARGARAGPSAAAADPGSDTESGGSTRPLVRRRGS